VLHLTAWEIVCVVNVNPARRVFTILPIAAFNSRCSVPKLILCLSNSANLYATNFVSHQVKVKVILWPTSSRPVSPGVMPPSGTQDQSFSSLSWKLSQITVSFHMPTQLNILVWLLMPGCGGESMLRKNVMSSTSSSGKCIGCLDAILSCQSTINSHYTSKLYVQFGVMVSSSGAALVNPIFKWFNATKTKH
jgi:hypothetical protein